MELRITERQITEAQISNLVDRFYAKVRLDPDLSHHSQGGWAQHLATLEHFGPNSGEETPPLQSGPTSTRHFEQWLPCSPKPRREVKKLNKFFTRS
jgi:hemoglobin